MRSLGAALVAFLVGQAPPPLGEIERLLGEGRPGDALAAVEAALVDEPNRYELLFLRGVALLRLDRAEEAAAVLASACDKQPSERRCLLMLGRAHLRAEKAEETLAVLGGLGAAERGPDVDALYGNALVQLERYEEAIPHLERALASSPDPLQAAFFLGQSYLFVGRFEEAAAVFRKGLDLPSPRNARFVLGAAEAELRGGNRDEAKRLLEGLLAAAPRAAQGWVLRAAIAVQEESFSEAVDSYQRAIDAGHRSPKTLLDFGVALASIGEPERALRALDEALALDPLLAAAHYYKGVLAARTGGSRVEAIRHLETAAALAPEPAIELALAEAFNQQHRPDLALGAAEKALAVPALVARAHFAQGVAEHQRLRYTEAESAYRRALSEGLESADLYFNLGRLYTALRRLEDAVASLEKAAALEPGRARSSIQLALVLQQKREWEKALEQLEIASRVEPGNVEAWHQRGIVESASGRSDDAIRSFRRALELDGMKLASLYRLGTELARVGEAREAEETLEKFRRLSEAKKRDEKLATELGVLVSSARRAASEGRDEEALGFLTEARTLAADHPEPYLELARFHLSRARIDAAEEVLREGLAVRPGDAELGKLLEEIRNK